MYTKKVFESAEEFFRACRSQGNQSPIVSPSVCVVFDGGNDPQLSGDDSDKFELGGISQSQMIEQAFLEAGSKVHIT